MPKNITVSIKRRQWLRLSAGALLTLGLWPGCARWAGQGRGGTFRFIVINDTHFHTPRCPAWFERVRARILSHDPKPEFCLVLGDLAEHGTTTELGAMREVLQSLDMEFRVVIGNHDYSSGSDRSAWDQTFPRSLNYTFVHHGWQFIGLDTTQGTDWQKTSIQSETLNWLEGQLPKLQPASPTVVFTHFPLGSQVRYRPLNADVLLTRFQPFNLVAVFSGHFHGLTEHQFGQTMLTTNRCCAIGRNNHDGSAEKGYFLCTAKDGQITRQFVAVNLT
ncbi:MAG TPA: metallophosphoesterase [Clostridia bacterium]|nr:metallophosphoesterase [Clostridia bacterium]